MILVNGVATGVIQATDRGVSYGDGVFRTLAVTGGKLSSWARQFAKLQSDARALGIPCPEKALLEAEVRSVAGTSDPRVVRITLTRGCGPRGYGPPAEPLPTRIIAASAWPESPADWIEHGVVARVCSIRLGWQPALAGIKHLNRLEHVLARAEWTDPAIAEGLLLDPPGNVISGIMSNVFIVEGNTMATPDLSLCGVAGVTRGRVMDGARRHGIALTVDRITVDRLVAAHEVILVNSVIGAWQVRRLGERSWEKGTMTARVRRWLEEEGD